MKLVFIADVFADEIPGGGELVNEEVIRLLVKQGHTVERIKSQQVTVDYITSTNSEGYSF